MNNQGSVEWLQLALVNTILTHEQVMQTIGLFEQAKGMHHKEVVDFVEDWYCNGPLLGGGVNLVETIEKHYNKTYGGNND